MFSRRVLRQYIVLAQELHFGRAAARLHMSQPPLSQAIARLEANLQVQLLDRNGRSVALTQAGKTFLYEAQMMLHQYDQAVLRTRTTGHGETGVVKLGFVGSVSYGLLPTLLARYRQELPGIEVLPVELTSAEQIQSLKVRSIDLAIVRTPLAGIDDFELKVIQRERMIAVLPACHPLARKRALKLQQLKDETFLVFPADRVLSLHAKTLMACHAAGFSPRIGLSAWQMPTMVGLIAAGMGVALLPEQIENMPHAGVVYRPLTDLSEFLDLEIALAWNADIQNPASVNIVRTTPGTVP